MRGVHTLPAGASFTFAIHTSIMASIKVGSDNDGRNGYGSNKGDTSKPKVSCRRPRTSVVTTVLENGLLLEVPKNKSVVVTSRAALTKLIAKRSKSQSVKPVKRP